MRMCTNGWTAYKMIEAGTLRPSFIAGHLFRDVINISRIESSTGGDYVNIVYLVYHYLREYLRSEQPVL